MTEEEQRREVELTHSVSAEVSQHVRAILSDAESAATAILHEGEQQAQSRRRAAEDEAREVLANAERDADALVQQRIRRIEEISDSLLSRAEALVARFSQAEDLRHKLEDLIAALGKSAEDLARESSGGERAAVATAEEVGEKAEEAGAPEVEAEAEISEEAEAEVVDAEIADAEVAEVPEPEPHLRAVRDDEGEAEPAKQAENGLGIDADDRLAARLVALQMAVAGGNRAEVGGHLRRAFEIEEPDPILDDVFGVGTGGDKRLVSAETGGDETA